MFYYGMDLQRYKYQGIIRKHGRIHLFKQKKMRSKEKWVFGVTFYKRPVQWDFKVIGNAGECGGEYRFEGYKPKEDSIPGRSTGSDRNIILKPARKFTLEEALEFIESDELVEVTPSMIRLRKIVLKEVDRRRLNRAKGD